MSNPNRPYATGAVNVTDVLKNRMKNRKKLTGRLTVVAMISLLVLAVVVGFSIFHSVNNKQLFDVTWHFDYAVITMNDGYTVEGPIDSWTDFADGDQIQVKINGVTYLTDASNVVLLSGVE